MKFVKNFFAVIFVIGGFAYTGFSVYQYSLGPCEKPIEYAVGRFDTEFGISKEEFKLHISIAEKVWETALNKDVFIYDPDSKFKINLIYDQRQLATIQKQRTESGLSAAEDILERLDAEFGSMKAVYEQKVAMHEAATAAFEAKQKAYTSEVDYWNSRDGAPKKEYEALQKQALILNREAVGLNKEAQSLNLAAEELNSLLEKRNLAAREYNKTAESYNQKFNRGLEFDQAEYTKEEINIYQFSNKKDLELALAHELGHALGMNHTDERGSIMYYLTSGNAETRLIPSPADLEELKRVCK